MIAIERLENYLYLQIEYLDELLDELLKARRRELQ